MYVATNSHILVPEFEYVEPASLQEVFALLAQHGAGARLIAGGTDLLVQMKLERIEPSCLVSLARVAELQTLDTKGGLLVGATVSIRRLATCEPVRKLFTALAEACDAFSTVPIMIMGTVGGNLCNASPAADTAPALLAFDAVLGIAAAGGTREVPIDKFFIGPGKTVLADGEVLQSIRLAAPGKGTASAFVKVSRVAADIAQVCAAVRLVRQGERVADCRIALGAVAPTPMRARRAESHLAGQAFDAGLLSEVAALVEEEVSPITDVRATVAHRRRIAGVIVRDALRTAWQRAGGGRVQ